MSSYISTERRVPRDHPLRAIWTMADTARSELSASLDLMYAVDGRPSIAPEKLLRALRLQVLYTVRSERQLMEQLNLLFRWFVGPSMDDPVWDVTVFTKNRERLLAVQVAQAGVLQLGAGPGPHPRLALRRGLHRRRYSGRGVGFAQEFQAKKVRTARPRRMMISVIPAWTFTVGTAPTPPTSRPPIPKHGCKRRAGEARPTSAVWGTSRWKSATDLRSLAPHPGPWQGRAERGVGDGRRVPAWAA